jgi:hypothetical protein
VRPYLKLLLPACGPKKKKQARIHATTFPLTKLLGFLGCFCLRCSLKRGRHPLDPVRHSSDFHHDAPTLEVATSLHEPRTIPPPRNLSRSPLFVQSATWTRTSLVRSTFQFSIYPSLPPTLPLTSHLILLSPLHSSLLFDQCWFLH